MEEGFVCSVCHFQCNLLLIFRIVGAFTDINQQKKLEAIQLAHALEKEAVAHKRAEEAEERRKEAEERRRGQGWSWARMMIYVYLPANLVLELLIDVTSHELRQPVFSFMRSR
jgi:hypothetical protein